MVLSKFFNMERKRHPDLSAKDFFSLKLMIIPFVFAILFFPVLDKIYYLIPAILVFILFKLDKDDLILAVVIILFLVITRTISSQLRDIVQIVNLILLFILFVKNNKENLFVSLPNKELLIFFVLYYSGLIVSSIYNARIGLGIQIIIQQSAFFLIVYFIYSAIKSNQTIKYIIWSLVFVSFFHSMAIFNQFYQVNFNIFELNQSYFMTVDSDLLLHKNSIGIYLFYSLFYLIYFFKSKQLVKNKYFYILAIVLLSISILLINNRGIFISIIAGIVYLSYIYNRKYFYYFIVLVSFLVTIILITPLSEVFSLYLRIESLAAGRDLITNATFNVIRDNWIFGAGPAGTKIEMYKDIPYLLGTPEEQWLRFHYNQIEYGHAHNLFLFMLSDNGILGFAASLFLVYTYFRLISQLKSKAKLTNDYDLINLSYIMNALGIGMFLRGLLEWGGVLAYGMIITDLPFWISLSIIIYFLNRTEIEN